MAFISSGLMRYLPIAAAICLAAVACTRQGAPDAPRGPEPIAYVGHGALFDQDGREIVPTAEFVTRAQDWYRATLLAGLDKTKQAEFAAFEKRLDGAIKAEGQTRLVVRQRALDWLVAHSPKIKRGDRILGKMNALRYQLTWRLPTGDKRGSLWEGGQFRLDPDVERKLNQPDLNPGGGQVFLATTNSGAAYIAECQNAGVPIPPPIGRMAPLVPGWTSQGFIPQAEQFIVGSPAEFRTYEDANGMCVALPRYNASKTVVSLDGVICLSKTSSKVCIWDNQMAGVTFAFNAGDKIPIGVPDTTIDPSGRYQAGGAELENGAGGVCTDCHAGENPYIVHPQALLRTGFKMGDLDGALPTFAPNRYVPLVAASWPQNASSQAMGSAPPVCTSCHVKGGAGRFPHLSVALNGYCNTILTQAIAKTMPDGDPPGSEASNPDVIAFKDWCNQAYTSSTEDVGDPHLTTTNGIHYDFQAAGEFTALRNSDTGFELQTRQTPVLTSFTPGANAYTGLASCVSLNTAAAVRVGEHRISYQPSPGRPGSPADMQLRIDGHPVTLPGGGINLGGGNLIAAAASGGGLDIKLADGTRLLITPNFWSSEGYWYLNVQVLNTPAREGTMGHIAISNWLPFAPNGSSFGPAPASLAARHVLLNQTFADAWRVKPATSLFDYAPGTSTATYTDRLWPPPSGSACRTASGTAWGPGQTRRPVQGMKPDEAKRLCSPVRDRNANENCVFDLTVMGDRGVLEAYMRTVAARAAAH